MSSSPTSLSSIYPTYRPVEDQAPVQESNARCLTDAKIKKIVASAIAALCLIGAALLITAAAVGFIASPAGWVAIPIIILTALAGGAIYYAVTRRDYENPKELAQMKHKAVNQDFRSLYKDHGPSHLVQDIFNEPGTNLSIDALRDKFVDEINQLDFETISGRYDLIELRNHRITPAAWYDFIQTKLNNLRQAESNHRSEAFNLDHQYSGRTERLQSEVRRVQDDLRWHNTLNHLHRRDRYSNRDASWTETAISAGGALANLAIHLSDGPARQQKAYDDAMAQSRTQLVRATRQLHQDYNQNYRNYLN